MSIQDNSAYGDPEVFSMVHGIAEKAAEYTTTFRLGFQIRWRCWGKGPLLVLLHGGHGSWMHWIRNIESLAEDYCVVAPDLPGFGDSDLPDIAVSVDDISQALSAGLDQLMGPETTPVFVGFSFGSVVAAHLVGLRKSRCARLVLVGCGRLGTQIAARPLLVDWRKITGTEARKAAHRHNLSSLMLFDAAKADDLAVYIQSLNTAAARLRSLRVVKTHRLRSCLAESLVPVDAIWGSRDPTLIGRIEDTVPLLREFDREASCIAIDGAGHWVQYEEAAQFNTVLTGLLGTNRKRRALEPRHNSGKIGDDIQNFRGLRSW
tara:strand:+ start:3761 stop:4717 length:957 start_codon:yes stop_codon:yes gene_type:complete